MSINERKQRERLILQEKILDEAFAIITQQGIEAFTIRALAQAIDYSPRTIYLYFKDKDDLLDALVEKGYQASWQQMQNKSEKIKMLSADQRIAQQIEAHVRTALQHKNQYVVVLQLLRRPSFSPGQFQQQVEQVGKSDFASALKLCDEACLTLLWESFLSSLRGFT
ncbi:MAG: TetR/AcrR family transcriptional regulator, partial [Spirochaetia bacterium]|nr:TetR/AcrR family transcriptional regulator [Spirochaetia bacterium]